MYDSGKTNLTLREIQREWVKQMNAAADHTRPGCAGFSVWLCGDKGDWKWKKEWLEEQRFYGRHMVCRRCLADMGPKLWSHMGPQALWDNPEDRAEASRTAVGEDAPTLALQQS